MPPHSLGGDELEKNKKSGQYGWLFGISWKRIFSLDQG
jgi:hypothetical protein